MSCAKSKQWMMVLDQTWMELLADHARQKGRERHRLHVKPCSTHGTTCVTVLFADVLQHIPWQATDAHELATWFVALVSPHRPAGKKVTALRPAQEDQIASVARSVGDTLPAPFQQGGAAGKAMGGMARGLHAP